MKEIKGILYMQRDEIIVYLMLETGFFLFGEILLWVIVYVAGEKEYWHLVQAPAFRRALIRQSAWELPESAVSR